MEISNEMKQRAATAGSAEELKAIAAEYGITLSAEEAEKYLAFSQSRELTDDELDIVAGGKGEENKPEPKYHTGQRLWVGYPSTKNWLGIKVLWIEFYMDGEGWRYYVLNDYGIEENYYLDTHKYVRTEEPHGWDDVDSLH